MTNQTRVSKIIALLSLLSEEERRQVSDKIEELNGTFEGWSWEDIQYQGKEDGYNLTKEQCLQVLGIVAKRVDRSIGINHAVISTHIWMWADDQPEGSVAAFDNSNEKAHWIP